MRAILDTSVVIATDVGHLDGELAIGSATVAELHFGVLVARDPQVRAERLRRLSALQRRFDPLPIDDEVAASYGQIAAGAGDGSADSGDGSRALCSGLYAQRRGLPGRRPTGRGCSCLNSEPAPGCADSGSVDPGVS